jgi:hypothetical protein
MKVCSKCKISKDDNLFYKTHAQCKKCFMEKQKNYHKINKEKITKLRKEFYESNKERLSERKKKYYQSDKERWSKYNKEYRIINKEKIAEIRKKYQQNKIKTDYLFKFKNSTRTLIRQSFKSKNNHKKTNTKTVDILGCSLDFFKEYIQSKFTKGMTLENHGKWHLDHIIPVSLAKTQEDVIRLNHYTNFQPLWAKENLIKSTKIITKQLTLI